MLKIIKLTIFILLVFFIGVGFSLFSGIKIDSFSFGNFSISQLYLKLDKKLILEVEEIIFEVKKSKVETSTDDIQANISKFEKVLKVFQKIDIERLKIKDNEFTIVLDNRQLYLDNKFINIAANLKISGSEVLLDVYSIYLKDIDLTFTGKSKIDLSKNMVNFSGKYFYLDLEGEVSAELTEKLVDFYVNTTKPIKSLKFLKDLFRLDEVAEAWMYDKVTGDINLNYLYGKIDLEKQKPIMDSIKGQAVINDAKVRFHKDAKTVNTSELMINYENDELSFEFEKPIYNKSKIYGSKVFITDLTSLKRGIVHVNLKSDSMLNSDVLEILRAFKINLPLRQLSGKLDSTLSLKIPYLASKKMDTNGVFKVKDAKLKLNDFEFLAKKADVVLKDTLVTVKNSHVIHKNMLDANLNLKIDTKSSKASGKAKVNSFKIKSDEESIVDINNLNTDLEIDFKKEAKIDLKALKTKLHIKKELIDIKIADLKEIYPYSKLLQTIGIKQGDLRVFVIDDKNIDFDINAKGLDFPFEKDTKRITTLSAKGKIRGDAVTIKTNDSDIEIVLKKGENTLLRLKNIDLVLNANNKNSKLKEEFPNVDLELKNSFIILDESHRYQSSWANIHIKNSKISFEGEALNLDLPISKKEKKVKDFVVSGTYENRVLDIKTKDGKLKLKYEIPKEKISMNLNGYDVLYDTNQESDQDSKIAYYITGTNSDIIINDKYIAKATKYKFVFENYKTDIDLKYKDTTFVYHKDFSGHITVEAKNMNDYFLNSIIGKSLIEGGNVNLSAIGREGVINGTAYLKGNKIVDLAILNNLLILINTSPAIINPFLAIPSVVGMAAKDGFNLNGYRVTEGQIDFSYDFDKKFLNMHKIKTKGNGIDFDGFTTINFETSKVDAKLHLVFLKDYANIVGAIPVINYVLLGDEKRVDTEVQIFGTIKKPQYKTKLIEEGVSAPVNVIKRIITSPVKLIETLGDSFKKEKGKKEKTPKSKEEIQKENQEAILNPKPNE